MRLPSPSILVTAAFITGCGGATPSASSVSTEASGTDDGPKDNTTAQPDAPAIEPDLEPENMEFRSRHNPNTDFGQFKTYAWGAMLGELNDPEGKWTPRGVDIAKQLMFLVDRELRKRGFQEVEENPDAIIAYDLLVDMETVRTLRDPDGALALEEIEPVLSEKIEKWSKEFVEQGRARIQCANR